MKKFINSSKFADELLFISNLDVDLEAAEAALARLEAEAEIQRRLRAQAAVSTPKLLMNSSSSPNFDELMNLFIKN